MIAGFAAFMIAMMVVWYTNPIEQAEALRVRVCWVFIFISLFKITPESFHYLIPGLVHERGSSSK
jgi:O-antigen/teichoic acid export membrane protein